MIFPRVVLVLTILSVAHDRAPAQTVPNYPVNLFPKPVKVFGDPEFIGTAANPTQVASVGPNVVEGRELSFPQGVALDTTSSPPILYVADTSNNRILAFQFSSQLKPGNTADLILGQQDRFQNRSGSSTGRSTQLTSPTAVAVDKAGNVYVADTGANRIVRYPKPFSQPPGFQIPDLILGQKSFASNSANQGRSAPGPETLAFTPGGQFIGRNGLTFDPQGNLWVSDTGNNRVLRYGVSTLNSNSGNDPNSDVVLGQVDFTSTVNPTAANSKTNLFHPQGLAFDSAGRLFVVDQAPSRVLVYPPGAGTNTAAVRILGLDPAGSTTQIGLSSPTGVTASGSGMVVADSGNNRLMVYPAFEIWAPESLQFSPSASAVIGQASFSANQPNQAAGDASSSSLSSPRDVISSGSELYVADTSNSRVLVFSTSPGGVTNTASRVIGQLDFAYSAPNLIEGKEFNFASGSVSALSGSVILDYSAVPPHLYVADTGNNRILGFRDFSTMKNGQKADLVIGQPDFFRSVINYPSNQSTQPNARGLNSPTSLLLDSAGNLYVADTGNSRVLRFPAPFNSAQTSLQSADLVIGQSSFTGQVTDATERTLAAPTGLAFTADGFNNAVTDAGWLVVADAVQNRVLFFPKPFSNGIAANKVLGQLNFASTATSADPPRLSSPRAVAVDQQDRILVADGGNGRVQIFTRAASLPNFATPSFSLPSGGPLSIAMSSQGSFWVAEGGNNRVSHYPSVDQLPLKNLASDGSVPVNSPRSAFADPYGNLLVGDGLNRVLYFAPQVDIVNAANYSARPLSPGTITSLFPHPQPAAASGFTANNAVLAGGTEAGSTLPLATTLADTQVIVNGTAAPLFYVSPGQINLQLSNTLPSGGTVDVQVIKASTGQVYGGAEIGLATASPALFTLTATGGGQIAAINVDDGTINSPQNPVQRDHYISLYGTGQGFIPNAPPDGFSAPVISTPEHPQILIGSTSSGTAAYIPDENIQYSGLAPLLVGVWQINVKIPATAPTGSQIPLSVLQASVSSIDPASTNPVTVIAVK